MSTSLGIDQEAFTKSLFGALSDPRITKALSVSFQHIENEILDLKALVEEKNEQIDNLSRRVAELEVKCDDLEQYSRRNSLRIHGLPESEYEDVGEKILDLANKALEVTPPITPADIDRVHRIGKQNDSAQPRPVILKLATYRLRDRIYRKRTKLKHAEVGKIYINEDITARRSNLLW